MTSIDAAPRIADYSLDFVYIDARHDYTSGMGHGARGTGPFETRSMAPVLPSVKRRDSCQGSSGVASGTRAREDEGRPGHALASFYEVRDAIHCLLISNSSGAAARNLVVAAGRVVVSGGKVRSGCGLSIVDCRSPAQLERR